MNILLVTMSMQIGGAETHVLELAKGLKGRGYTVYVMSNGGDYVQELESSGIEHIKAPMHNRDFRNIISSYRILKQIIKDKKIDVVHAHARIPAMIASFVCKRLKVPFVTTAHGIYTVNPVLRFLTNWGQKTIVVSEDVKDYVINEYGVKEENVIVTVNGIDMDKFSKNVDYSSIAKEFNIEKNKKQIVHVSRLDAGTSIVANELIDIAQDFKNAQFIIVGGGTELEDLKAKAKLVNEKSKEKLIVFPGPRIDINQFTALADVFVGVSRAALEAMAAETPVILAGNQGYLGMFSKDNLKKALETNFCCRGLEKPSAENLRNDLRKMLNTASDELKVVGKYNREIVKMHYSIDKMVDDAIKMYESVCKACISKRNGV